MLAERLFDNYIVVIPERAAPTIDRDNRVTPLPYGDRQDDRTMIGTMIGTVIGNRHPTDRAHTAPDN